MNLTQKQKKAVSHLMESYPKTISVGHESTHKNCINITTAFSLVDKGMAEFRRDRENIKLATDGYRHSVISLRMIWKSHN